MCRFVHDLGPPLSPASLTTAPAHSIVPSVTPGWNNRTLLDSARATESAIEHLVGLVREAEGTEPTHLALAASEGRSVEVRPFPWAPSPGPVSSRHCATAGAPCRHNLFPRNVL